MTTKEAVGKVISTFDSPSTVKIVFVVCGDVHKGQYVEVFDQGRIYIALVNELLRSNKYFERPETVMDYERVGELNMHFPTDDWEYMIAEARLFGVYNETGNLVQRTVVPPSPGAKVFIADNERLKKFIGISDSGLYIGTLPNHKIDVKLDLSRLFQKHLAILAMSGAGKSYLNGVLIEELLSRKKEDGRLGVVVIDIHGEYTGFKQAFPKQVEIVKAEDIRIPLKALNALTIGDWFEGMTEPQKRELSVLLAELKKQEQEKNMRIGLAELEQLLISKNDGKQKELKNLFGWITAIKKLKLISYTEKPKLSDTIQPGKLTIIDMKGIDNHHKKQIIAYWLCQRLFNLRKKGKVCPFVLMIEEAHNFAKEKATKQQAIAKGIIETIAREGRKFGASIVLITQRPVRLSTTALSQCNTNIILRITNPFDQKHIAESSEGIDNYIMNSLSTLHVGEAIIVGEATNIPIMVSIRKRNAIIKKNEINLKELALQFEKEKEKVKSDAEAFI